MGSRLAMQKAFGKSFIQTFRQFNQESTWARLMATAAPSVETPTQTHLAQSLVKTEVPVRGDQSQTSSSANFSIADSSLPKPKLLNPKKTAKELTAAIQQLQKESKRKFDETIDVVFKLGTDPRRGDQQVRGAVNLPHGTGKSVKVCVFTDGEAAEIATSAGADLIGSEATIAEIKAGNLSFDKCLATANMMPKLSAVARVLGPRGLMPNPKLGTLVDASSLPQAIRQMKAGRVEYRADKTANLHVGIGKASFSIDHLQRNFGVLANAILNARPKGAKGSGATGYILQTHLSSTMGRGIPISMSSVLATAQRCKGIA